MATLGTKKFYKSFNSIEANKNQILKNTGYISISLHSAYYRSQGNFWQRTFGGNDKIALSSSVTYKSSDQTIEAKSIVDKRKVKANRNHTLGLSRLIALKVPATADGLELKIEFTAVKDDNFENGLNLMNSEEFQTPLQLSSIAVGQIISITNVVKKIFTGIENPSVLATTFAGIISKDKVDNPIDKERLTAGYLIMISNTEEDDSFLSQIDESKFSIEGDGLKYDNKTVQHTNLVFSITYDPLKGVSEESSWFKKYRAALNKLDDIVITNDNNDQIKILNDSKKLWIEGNTLLFDDNTYIDSEKVSIRAAYLKKINERFIELTTASENTFIEKFLGDKIDGIDFISNLKSFDEKEILSKINKINSKYLKQLGSHNMILPL